MYDFPLQGCRNLKESTTYVLSLSLGFHAFQFQIPCLTNTLMPMEPSLPTRKDLLTSSLISMVERITQKADRKSRTVPLMVKVDCKNAAIVEADSVSCLRSLS